jgi:hypothetical protein
MLIGVIVAAVAVVVLVATVLTRRVTHDDVHSVEGYHRSLHTLETINAHPADTVRQAAGDQRAQAAFPESAVRLAGSPTVRVTDLRPGAVPPVPPPPVNDADRPLKFDDEEKPAPPSALVAGQRDKAMVSINHRPRRLAAPATALAAVAVLIVVLLLTGSHTVAPPPRHPGAPSTKGGVTPPASKSRGTAPSTTTTAPVVQPPAVSLPQGATPSAATYEVANGNFTLAFSATTSACWIDATNPTSGSTIFAGTLEPGEQRSFDLTGPVTLEIGAPGFFAATVDGVAAELPPGFLTPFTMKFVALTPPT